MQTVSGPDCAIRLIERRKAKQQLAQEKLERIHIKQRKLELKPLNYWAKRAEKACNAYVLVREAAEPCISCGSYDSSAYHAGHFISVGASSALRFDTRQIRKQCSKCNVHLSGNLINYEKNLVALIGRDEVESIKNAPRSRKWTREEYQAIEKEFKEKLKHISKV